MPYLEYNEENADLQNLEANFIDQNIYNNIHEKTIIACHDVFVRCTHNGEQGLLLVKRLREPAKDVWWPIGGRILRGVPTEVSLSTKVKNECGLTLHNIHYLGVARTFFNGEPFGHNHGTDTLNLVYIADGEGEVVLDKLHTSPYIVSKEIYSKIRPELPKYVQQFLDMLDSQNMWISSL